MEAVSNLEDFATKLSSLVCELGARITRVEQPEPRVAEKLTMCVYVYVYVHVYIYI